MAQTEFVGNTFTVAFNDGTAYALDAVLDVKIVQKGGPDAEQLDVTVYGDSVYTYLSDPLGPKGQATTTVTVVTQASTASYADGKSAKIDLNSSGTLTVALQPGTANANEFAHTALELTKRVTVIPYKGTTLATQTLTFEGNGAGTWDSPA